ncbi:MAG TPA: YraN family protein [Melioribacteraceae bacterium]|nr:YraN family protein [Melioribacteraceae bacterium]
MEKKERGKSAEDLAEEYLRNLGYEIIARNYTISHNEIDIIAKDGNYLVFVEVRSKSNISYGKPEESLTVGKRKQVKKAAEMYLMQNQYINLFIRLDFIGITYTNEKPHINHLKNAF